MTDIIDLSAERNRREAPDPEFISYDEQGRPMYCFTLEYHFGGSDWDLRLWAYSFDDAEKRAAAIQKGLTVIGQIHSIVPD